MKTERKILKIKLDGDLMPVSVQPIDVKTYLEEYLKPLAEICAEALKELED